MNPAVESAVDLWPLALYAAVVFGVIGFMLIASWFLGGRSRPAPGKDEPYESGVVHEGTARLRLSAKFYLVAVFFVIFDLEAVFIFAWAVVAREAGWAGYIEMSIFVLILLVGLIYLWKLGALDWAPKNGGRYGKRAPPLTPPGD